jgi:hypothetical protein
MNQMMLMPWEVAGNIEILIFLDRYSLGLFFHTHVRVSLFWRDTRPNFRVYKFTLPFEPYRRTCTRFYGRGRALKTSQFFFKPTPNHDGPPFDPMRASEAEPQASAAASHPGDATRVAARSDLANGGGAGTVFGVVAICYKWGDVKNPQ